MSNPLYDAIVANDIKAVRAALADPVVAARIINLPVAKDDSTPLIKAVGKKVETRKDYDELVEIVEALLKVPEINVNSKTVYNVTALIQASYNGRFSIVKELLKVPGIYVNVASKVNKEKQTGGITALYAAVESNSLEIVKELLDKSDIDVNTKTAKGTTPLLRASLNGNLEIVKALLNSDEIDVNAADKDGNTALFIASSKGNLEIVKALLKADGIKVNAKTLMAATNAGHSKVAEELRKKVPGITVERVQTMAPSVLWKGMAKTTIDMFDWVLDNTRPKDGGLPPAETWSACPVCLKYVLRSEGCMYLSHNCSAELGDAVFHAELYDRYKDRDGRIFWCVVCSRICSGHRHYLLTPHSGEKPDFASRDETFFGGDSHCKAAGGGGIAEKIARIRRLREYALELEAYIGKKDTREAMKELVEATWDAPLTPYEELVAKISKEGTWNIPSNLFLGPPTLLTKRSRGNAAAGAGTAKRLRGNAAAGAGSAGPAWNIAYPNAGNPELLPIIHSPGYDSTLMNDVAVAIQFRHKLPTREVNYHVNEYIGIDRLFREVLKLRRIGEGRGRCWNFPHCNARMFPAELQYILDHVNDGAMKVTDKDMTEYQRLLDLYTESFGYAPPIVGGRRRKTRKTRKARNQKGGADERFTLGPATLAECVVAGGGRKTQRRRHRDKNSRKRRL
jgi:hypothetical protein